MAYYQNAFKTSQDYLMNQGGDFTEEETKAIRKAKEMGYGDNIYIPAIAKKRMEAEDTELADKYNQFKASPTTIMSGVKSQYGKEGRGFLGATAGFVWNAFVDVAETAEEIGSAVIHPVKTAKGLASAAGAVLPTENGAKMRGALMDAVKDNFGSWEKAKEVFYENPFDVLSTLVPIVGGVSKLGKVTLASKLGEASGLASKASKISSTFETARGASKAVNAVAGTTEFALNRMKDFANIDNWILNTAGKGIGKTADIAKDAYSSIIYGPKGEKTMQKVFDTTKDAERVAKQSEYASMMPSEIGEIPKGMKESLSEGRSTLARGAFSEAAEQGPTRGVGLDTGAALNKDMFDGKTFMPGDGKNFIKISETGKVPKAVKEAEKAINVAFTDSGITDKTLSMIESPNLEKLRKQLDFASGAAKDIQTKQVIDVFAGQVREFQNRTFKGIGEARKTILEHSQIIDTFVSEVGKNIKDSTIGNKIIALVNDTGLDAKKIEFLAKQTGVNLEDVAVALSAKSTLGRMGKSNVIGALFTGAATNLVGGGIKLAFGIASGAAFTSPALIYKIATTTGPARKAMATAIAKASGAKLSVVNTLLDKVAKAKDVKGFGTMVKGLEAATKAGVKGIKATKKPSYSALLKRLSDRMTSAESAEDIQEQRTKLKGSIEELNNADYGLNPEENGQPQEEEEDRSFPELGEGEIINPNYL